MGRCSQSFVATAAYLAPFELFLYFAIPLDCVPRHLANLALHQLAKISYNMGSGASRLR
jgi:hypothetical protein